MITMATNPKKPHKARKPSLTLKTSESARP